MCQSVIKGEEPDNLYARAAILIDADSGRILYGKNENDVMPMASTTKIMTLLVALKYSYIFFLCAKRTRCAAKCVKRTTKYA